MFASLQSKTNHIYYKENREANIWKVTKNKLNNIIHYNKNIVLHKNRFISEMLLFDHH